VGSLTLGAGQFCTNPGLILAVDSPELEAFVAGASKAVSAAQPATMLTPGIHKAYCQGVAALNANATVKPVAKGVEAEGYRGQAAFFSTSAAAFMADHSMQDEVFGAASLLVRCPDLDSLVAVIDSLEGQLTAAVHTGGGDTEAARKLLPHLEKKAGRILFNGFGTGVEVCHAMVHGGPFPSTSDGRSTSVGSLAIARFLRPVSYQDVPADLLPPALQDANPQGIPRRINGKLELGS
jgi:NADP-dependent aldehyde dehydrogenase